MENLMTCYAVTEKRETLVRNQFRIICVLNAPHYVFHSSYCADKSRNLCKYTRNYAIMCQFVRSEQNIMKLKS